MTDKHERKDYPPYLDCPRPRVPKERAEAARTDRGDACDMVNHPGHYTHGGIECIDAMESAVSALSGIEAVLAGNVIKYVWRFKHKNGVQDLEKAKWYLNRLIRHEKEGKQGENH